ncbi:TetR/AcrR family transcriptional regulator [Luxibacter massiliensis]|uniref:TetR/AcrR family transcriptional regulator n=1 Tax=Luxibacter massiliensis TaxID=2219695 RepID=UPI000F06C09E|nr:TetR/AcrR family transcriptional regulator [Luxibacter massiliensis]
MAKQIEGVYEAVLERAKKEFLEKGYKDASMRVIAQEAGTSTGSIYTRFGDKEGLFQAVVEPAAVELKNIFLKVQEDFHSFDEDVQKSEMGQYTSQHQMEMLDYIYDHFEEFRILLDSAEGTRFSCFLDELVDIEVEYTYKYMEVIGCESVKSGLVTEEFIHMVVTAYFNGMFEVVRHNMRKEEAVKYVRLLNRYHMQGFSTVFNPETP